MNGVSALTQEAPGSSLCSSAMRGHGEKSAVYEQGSGSSPNTKSANAVTLDFPDSRTIGNKFLFV